MHKVTLKLTGMHCTSCSVLIDTALEELPGIDSPKPSDADQKVEVEFAPTQIDAQRMIATIQSEGYEATT